MGRRMTSTVREPLRLDDVAVGQRRRVRMTIGLVAPRRRQFYGGSGCRRLGRIARELFRAVKYDMLPDPEREA